MSGAAITLLTSVPSGAGILPAANTAALLYTTTEDTSVSDETTSSATYADTTLSIAFTPGKAGLCFFHVSLTSDGNAGGGTVSVYAIVLDTVVKQETSTARGTGGGRIPVSLSHSAYLTAALHTVKVQFKCSGGGIETMLGATTTARLVVSYPT